MDNKVNIISDTNRIGDINEHKAIVWLWEQGHEVFKNCGCTGKIDLIAVKDYQIFKINVKTVRKTSKGYCFSSNKERKFYMDQGIKLLYVWKDQVGWNRDFFNFQI